MTYTNNLLVWRSSHKEILLVFFRMKLNAVCNFTAGKSWYTFTCTNPASRLSCHKTFCNQIIKLLSLRHSVPTFCPDWQRCGQQNREIVCPVKQRCAKNSCLFTSVLRTCEDDRTFAFRQWEKWKYCSSKLLDSIHIELKIADLLTSHLPTCLFLFTSITDGMSIFRTFLILLFSLQWVSADFANASKKNCRQSGHAPRHHDTISWATGRTYVNSRQQFSRYVLFWGTRPNLQ